jgi:hypothetical protein
MQLVVPFRKTQYLDNSSKSLKRSILLSSQYFDLSELSDFSLNPVQRDVFSSLTLSLFPRCETYE